MKANGRARSALFDERGGGAGPRRTPGAAVRWIARVRARDWVHFLALPLASAGSLVSGARGVAIAASVLSFGYLVNGLADRNLDRDLTKNPLVDGRGVYVAEACVALSALALVLALTGPPLVVVATTICLCSGIVYSIGPRLKRLPGVGTLLNLTNFLPLLWVGSTSRGAPGDVWLLAIAFAALLLQNQLVHEAADASEDHAGGVQTTLLAIGPRSAALVSLALGVAVTVSFAYGHRIGIIAAPVVGVLFAVAFPALLWAAGHRRFVMRRLRLAHRWCSVAAGAVLFLAVRLQA